MNDRTDVVTYRPVVRKDGNCKLGYGAQMTDAPDNRDSDWRGEDSRQWVKLSDYAALQSLLLDARAERDLAIAMVGQADAFTCELADKLRAAEALSGGFEGLLRRILVLPEAQHQLSMLRKGIGTETATGVYLEIANSLAAIDAVGGRGE